MRNYILSGLALLLTGISLLAAPEKETPLLCTLTNQKVTKCCCETRDGKLFCMKAQKEVKTCCCKPVEK